MASRDIKELIPELRKLFNLFDAALKAQGVNYVVTCTKRTQADQDALYSQGRTKPGQIVTWTRKSKHIEGKAFDIAIIKDGKVSWSPVDYKQAGEIGRGIGLDWGGSWSRNKDYPHFQIKEEENE